MKKVLITGTFGFIFGNFIRKAIFEKHPYTFVSVDKVTKSSVLNNIYQNKSHSFYIGDVADQHFMNVLFEYERPDIVIHGAAETFTNDSLNDPNKFIRSNILGTQSVINSCVKWGVEKLIYISTTEVYGQLTNENDAAWTEDSLINPRNPNAASKASGELLVKAANASYGLNYNITRSSNNYGPRQSPEKLIPKVIKCILNNEKIPVYGQGLQLRDWLYVNDNCAAILTILKDGKINETYNISANQECSNIELIQKICNIMKLGHHLIQNIDDPRKGHDYRYAMDSSKIRNIGWKSEVKLTDGLEICINWYESNKWYLK